MVVFAHLSDMHVSPLPTLHAHEFSVKRALAYLSWHRKRKHRFSAEILQHMIADFKAEGAAHLLVTGDQCNLSLEAEFVHAAAWLQQMGVPRDVSVIPGNHDAHLRNPEKAWNTHWAEFMRGDDGSTEFPYLRVRDGVAIIGVSSAIPTKLFMANGRVGRAQLKRLRELLLRTKEEGLFRLVMIHHPPQVGAMKWRKALSDASAFRAVLKEFGAELVLHGHGHVATRAELQGPGGAIAVRGSASASGNGYKMPAAHYHLIEVKQAQAGWEVGVTHRQLTASGDGFETVLHEALAVPRV